MRKKVVTGAVVGILAGSAVGAFSTPYDDEKVDFSLVGGVLGALMLVGAVVAAERLLKKSTETVSG